MTKTLCQNPYLTHLTCILHATLHNCNPQTISNITLKTAPLCKDVRYFLNFRIIKYKKINAKRYVVFLTDDYVVSARPFVRDRRFGAR